MDATTPFRRWLCSAGLLTAALSGCQTPGPGGSVSTDGPGASPLTARPQMPTDPIAPGPLPPSIPGVTPIIPGPLAPSTPNLTPSIPGPLPTATTGVAPTIPGSLPPSTPGIVTGSPVTPAASVPGEPITPNTTVPASYTAAAVSPPKLTFPGGPPRLKVVAIVGADNIVTEEEVWQAVRQRGPDYLVLVDGAKGKQIITDPVKEKKVYSEEFRHIIERELILDDMYDRLKKAKKLDVIEELKSTSEKAADQQLQDYKVKRMKVQSDKEFRMILASQGLSIPVLRRQLERQMMATEYVRSMFKEKGKEIGLTDIRAYYESHQDAFRTPDRVKWQDIFVSFNKFPNPRDAYDHAIEIQQQAVGGADFAALSKQYDQGLAGQQGGEGIGQKRGEIQPPDVEPMVWELKPGQVSPLIETPAGYHIVKVVERDVAGLRPFSVKVQIEIRGKLQEKLHEQEYKKMVDDLWWRGRFQVIDSAPH
jgi:peptidyl-prolyl cis-trans isomerase SurA